jgi:2-methylcitrate dehydratase PrpD
MDGLDNTFALAQYLSHLSYDNLPEQVVLQAKNSVLNALGCGIGYSHHGPAQKAMSMVETNSGPGVATMLGRSQHASIENAMLINGIALTTADYDDTHLRTVIHPSGTPLAALISFAEANHMTGKDFLLAFVCGVETQCAVGNAISPSHYRDGW